MTPALSLTLRARRAADVLALTSECSAILEADTPADLHRALARAEVRLRRLRHDVAAYEARWRQGAAAVATVGDLGGTHTLPALPAGEAA